MKIAFFLKLLLLTTVTAVPPQGGASQQDAASRACRLLRRTLPGAVSFPGSPQYEDDIFHYEASSTQNSTCSVTPSSAEDVSQILRIVGRDKIRSPFAVKSGGHSSNIGFSSTTGVHIAMSNFTDVDYDPVSQTVKIGSGLTWDQVYAKLEPFNVSVVGGRVPGVGIGLALGGGYSWLSNQYGLSVDTVTTFDLVLPNGTFSEVTNSSHPELFFGLKGGLNNFGIVTALTMKAYPLSSVWGGIISYSAEYSDEVSEAVAKFSLENTDSKAELAAAHVLTEATPIWQVIFFYDGEAPPSLFQPFLEIPSMSSNVSLRSYTNFLETTAVLSTQSGGLSNAVPVVQYTLPLINEIQRQVNITYTQAISDNRSILAILLGVEPLHGAFDHSTPSAYPHPSSRQVTPCNPWITFSNLTDAPYFHKALRDMSDAIQAFAIQEGQSRADDIHYPNYALGDTPLKLLYGDNIPRLRAIKQAVDPKNVMGLAGGYKF